MALEATARFASMRSPLWLRQAPRFTVILFLAPIAAGLLGTVLPAFGWLPAIGGRSLTLAPWTALFSQPGIGQAIALTLSSGFIATFLSVAFALGFCALIHGRGLGRPFRALMMPLLAAPHAAMAIGVAFLIAPSGWVVRLLSPWLTGWRQPPDISSVQDPHGVALILGLLVKEVPYLLLMTITALGQVPASRQLQTAAALGYGRTAAWLKLILPQVYPQIRLPLYAVLAYALSVVDMALILGPSNPPTLSVLALRWFTAPDVRLYFPAAAAAILQLVIVTAGILIWRSGERGVARLGRKWIAQGRRGTSLEAPVWLAGAAVVLLAALGLASWIDLAIWSFASGWRFPHAWPDVVSLQTWSTQFATVLWPFRTTLVVALVTTTVALLLVLACLENEQRSGGHMSSRALWVLYVPLLVPQIAFLFGGQVLLVAFHLDGTLAAVIWSHLLFVLPYVFLSLGDPWRSLDDRYARTALCLGASPRRVFLRVKLPLLIRPVLVAGAVGLAVSVDQYLPTVFAGAGRVVTLTTEAVTLASGGDRRITGVYGVLQALLPLVAYGLAIGLPDLLHARRRAPESAR
jgi:putative thiamine transport system permease protein